MRPVMDRRFEDGLWPIDLVIPAPDAANWMAHLSAEVETRGWTINGLTQLDSSENSGTLSINTANSSPDTIEIVWEKGRRGAMRLRARMLLKSNPNIVGLLWLRENEYVHRHATFDLLYRQRAVFSSQAAADSFAGYAYGQLKRMEAFDLERMADYEALTEKIRAHGPLTEVLQADSAKLAHLARQWGLPLATLNEFRKLHRQHFSG